MDKLTRVSNSLRGKKLIVCSGDYYQFIESVKIKFDIGPDAEICLQDHEGAEIDEQVFPILLEQPATPNIEFIIKGEEQAELSLDYSFAPSSSLVYSENSTKHGNSLPVLSPIKAVPQSPQFTQILESMVQNDLELNRLVRDCNDKGFVDSATSSVLIKSFVAKLI
ncbi:uncharacterized protein LOC118436919 [Folsomia candida]|nr:uncharacterized protein LOC118436919 [Folsomia candida]